MSATKKRGLSQSFLNDWRSGRLAPLLRLEQVDQTLSLNIRAGYVNVYYRGGSLLKIREVPGQAGKYVCHFDQKYATGNPSATVGLPALNVNALPRTITSSLDVNLWVQAVPALKYTMDFWFHAHPRLEREYQQLVERSNNENSATDYFICDLEYTHSDCRELRADFLAFHWASSVTSRKGCPSQLAIIEMKFADSAMSSGNQGSGLVDHVLKLKAAVVNGRVFFADLAREMVEVFSQKVHLELLKCPFRGKEAATIAACEANRPEFILLVADHDPERSGLQRELRHLQSINPSSLPFAIRIASANSIGYGLFDSCIYDLPEYQARFAQQIAEHADADSLLDNVSPVGNNAPIGNDSRVNQHATSVSNAQEQPSPVTPWSTSSPSTHSHPARLTAMSN